MDPFDEASELVHKTPLPLDIMEQLDRLRRKVPKDKLFAFDCYYEIAAVSDTEGVATKGGPLPRD